MVGPLEGVEDEALGQPRQQLGQADITLELERLVRIDEQQVIYRLPRTQRDGTTVRSLTQLELIDHLAAQLVPSLAAAQAPPPSLPRRARAQRAPAWDDDLGPTPDWDLIAQPDPGFELDQRVSW